MGSSPSSVQDNYVKKANNSFRWTAFAQLLSKIISPLMNMVLARLIAPSVFGIVASIAVVSGLAQIITENGFGRFLVQRNFKSEEDFKKTCGTSLTSIVVFGLFLVGLTTLFSTQLTGLVDCSGYEIELIVSSLAIPLFGIVSIQVAVLRRTFKYKKIGIIRISSSIIMFVSEIILAFLGYGIWSLVLGSVLNGLFMVLLFFFFSAKEDKFGFSFSGKIFRNIFTDGFLFMVEAFLTWVSSSIDVLIISSAFSLTLSGVYKNAFNTEKGITGVITNVFAPVLLSLLSRTSDDDKAFNENVNVYQRALSLLIIPLGFGMFLFRDELSYLFFGSGWGGAEIVLAAFAITDCFKISISDIASLVFISKGKPIYSIISQIFYIISIVFCCIYAKQLGFFNFVVLRASCILILTLCSAIELHFCKVKVFPLIKALFVPVFCALIMCLFGLSLQTLIPSSIWWTIVSVLLCMVCYFIYVFLLAPSRLRELVRIIKNK